MVWTYVAESFLGLELFHIASDRFTRKAGYLDYFLAHATWSSRFIKLDQDWELKPLNSFLDFVVCN